MALLELGGKKLTIPVGDSFLGSEASCAVQLPGSDVLPKHAAFQALADGQVVIRKAVPQAEVLINGVRLGAEPTPLLHGDKVEVGGHELTFVDERRSGSTMYVQAVNAPQAAAQAKAAAQAGKATGNTGGRVVCLTDGREYAVAGSSLIFGRDATCDVVVPGKDVSRRHAEIVQTPRGYLLVDSSTNGTFVNEERVEGQRILLRTDVIRIGDENFRFYADPAPSTPPAAPGGGGGGGGAAPPGGGGNKLRDTMHGAPAEPPASRSSGGTLANFLVRSGSLKGQRLQVRTPIANIGRADYNDLMIPDESVSTAHAKLQRREGIWVLVDLNSTNGTFVDGERLGGGGETPLAPGATIRFGDVALVFEPTDDALGVAKGGGTRVIEAAVLKPPPAPAPAKPKAPPAKPKAPAPAPAPTPGHRRPAARQPEPKKGKGCGSSAAMVVLGIAAFIYWIWI